MHIPTLTTFSLLLPLLSALSADTPSDTSSHNLYLTTCTQRSGRKTTSFSALAYFANASTSNSISSLTTTPSSLLSPRQRHHRPRPKRPRPGRGGPWRGPPPNNNNTSLRPDESAIIADPAVPWEGANVSTTLWVNTDFDTYIDDGAASLGKGGIAGSVVLAEEEYVCFRDGETEVKLVGGEWEDGGRNWGGRGGNGKRGTCVADYWCGGLGAGVIGQGGEVNVY
ncbi:hypothetical protein EJ04DRAFT_523379 [Polyplosphaeria fusca]|uniref:Uncharacterized protein n=1 Tax=Polyplosphaeria fusca TaxID=682080 RepID=A0A9P4R161_9PLEO|nr:hypothetical protein EJ04DRAFT_523379 [Polyplosphaeria fusca]